MRLILDSNILISALIRDSKTREIILKSGFEFFHPRIAIENLNKYKELIIQKSGLDELEYEIILKEMVSRIALIDNAVFLDKLKEANRIMDKIDIEDVVFIALALSIQNDGIWTDDSHFQKQKKIKIYRTEDIVDILR